METIVDTSGSGDNDSSLTSTPDKIKKSPCTLLFKDIKCTAGEIIMNFIIKTAEQKPWDSSFAHGKLLLFIKELHDTAFNADGELNMYKQPPLSTFSRAISHAKKILEELISNHV